MLEPIDLVEALYRAVHSKHGIIVQCSEPEKLRQKLYAKRKELDDESLKKLRFATSRTNPESELLIVNTGDNS
jgi:hypothetical protein